MGNAKLSFEVVGEDLELGSRNFASSARDLKYAVAANDATMLERRSIKQNPRTPCYTCRHDCQHTRPPRLAGRKQNAPLEPSSETGPSSQLFPYRYGSVSQAQCKHVEMRFWRRRQ